MTNLEWIICLRRTVRAAIRQCELNAEYGAYEIADIPLNDRKVNAKSNRDLAKLLTEILANQPGRKKGH